jgi:hypothetical protein
MDFVVALGWALNMASEMKGLREVDMLRGGSEVSEADVPNVSVWVTEDIL